MRKSVLRRACIVAIAAAGSVGIAHAQSVSLDLGHGGAPETAKLIQLVLFIGLMALAPSLLVMLTAFTRIIIVLSILRTALGMQTMPPNTVLIGLSGIPPFSIGPGIAPIRCDSLPSVGMHG
uniref:hypothetical protein n=1 Tax=Acidiphilium acidophilum TaxID=76588 RepID=UPI00386FF759